MQDLAVIGMGLIGSAALRHAAGSASVVGIGPTEPTDWAAHPGPFASHYDSGRVTRRIDARREWAILASRAIENYAEIEERSGIRFHRRSGMVFARSDEAGLAKLRAVASELNIPIRDGRAGRAFAEAGGLSFPDSVTIIADPAPAGAINPRAMIEAQLRAAEVAGAVVARDTVMSIRPALSGFELLTTGGRTHQARNVLVAAGAYSNDLLGESLAVSVRPEVVALGEVTEEQADLLADMPSLVYLPDHPGLDDVYVVPPARDPDGRLHIKIGGSQRQAGVLSDPDAMNAWMQAPPVEASLNILRDALKTLMPSVAFIGWHAKNCLITDTASGLPYIDRLESGVTVAFGGNGHAAKSADAIGALGSDLALTSNWSDEELPASLFSARVGTHHPSPGSRHGNS